MQLPDAAETNGLEAPYVELLLLRTEGKRNNHREQAPNPKTDHDAASSLASEILLSSRWSSNCVEVT